MSPNIFRALSLFTSLCLLCHAEESIHSCASHPSAEQPPSDDSVSLLQIATILESGGRGRSAATDTAKDISDGSIKERKNTNRDFKKQLFRKRTSKKVTCGDEVCNAVTMYGFNTEEACLAVMDAEFKGCCHWNPAEGGCMGCGDKPCREAKCGDQVCNAITMYGFNTEEACLAVTDAEYNGCCHWNPAEGGCMGCGDKPCSEAKCGDQVCNAITMYGLDTSAACLAVTDAKSHGCCNWNPAEGGCMGCGDKPCRAAPIVVKDGTCESNGYASIFDADECKAAAFAAGYKVIWGPHGGYDGVVHGCSVRFDKDHGNLFLQRNGKGHCWGNWNNKCLCKKACSYTKLDDSKFCSGGYYRGNCELGNKKFCDQADLTASKSLEACKRQCDAEKECLFIAYKTNVCSRYNAGAGDCSSRRGGGHTLYEKSCQA